MVLEDAGIRVMIFDQRDSSYNSFGYIYVNVQQHDVDSALKLMSEYE